MTPIELEYWRGPEFSDEIEAIPSGVTEHKASDRIRMYEGVDRAQFWWKAEDDDRKRTFEAEEIRNEASFGVSEDYFGCRYVHAEYSSSEKVITHFDGAIRGYELDKMVERMDVPIDRAGKHADYTKLFRIDGKLGVAQWKAAVVDYFRGNYLFSEYFGSPQVEGAEEQEASAPRTQATRTRPPCQVMIGYLDRTQLGELNRTSLLSFEYAAAGSQKVVAFDAMPPALDAEFSTLDDYKNGVRLEYEDRLVNLPIVALTSTASLTSELQTWLRRLSSAASADRSHMDLISVAAVWPYQRYWVILSLCGELDVVVHNMPVVSSIVRPDEPPSHWIMELKHSLQANGTSRQMLTSLQDVQRPGLLRLKRAATEVQFRVPSTHPLYEALRRDAECHS
jgi:hypothetical protein